MDICEKEIKHRRVQVKAQVGNATSSIEDD